MTAVRIFLLACLCLLLGMGPARAGDNEVLLT